MNKIRRILSMALACVMMIALVPVISPVEVSAAEPTGTTALFNKNATYLLEEIFTGPETLTHNDNSKDVISGWDTDYRGGTITAGGGKATLTDTSSTEKVSMNHKLMSHQGGGLVLETAFSYTTAVDEGFYYEVLGDGNTALKLSVVESQGGYYLKANNTVTNIACTKDTTYYIKAEFSTTDVTLWVNGTEVGTYNHVKATDTIDEIEIGTTDVLEATICLNFVCVYINYTVNETFMASPVGTIPAWWDNTTVGEVEKAPGSPYAPDPNGFLLPPSNTEPKTIFSFDLDDAGDLTYLKGTSSDGYDTSTNADGINVTGRSNIVKVTGIGTTYDYVAGVSLGENFAFTNDDTISYSVDYYSTATVNPAIWLRRRTAGGSTDPYKQYNHTATSGSWNTLEKTVKISEINGHTSDKGTWTDAGPYALYIRSNSSTTGIGTCYLDNFKVTVTKSLSFDEPGVLEKSFSALSGEQSFVWEMLVPEDGADGFSASFGGAEFTAENGKFKLNGTDAYTYAKNVWYKIELRTNGSTADLYINNVKRAEGASASETRNKIRFEGATSNPIILDDIQVYKTFDKDDYSDYPELDESNIPDNGDFDLGMICYSMWREGTHYGWDLISPYDDRVPTLGYYTGGSIEVADWHNKWFLEHGIDHAIYPFTRPNISRGVQPNFSIRGEELHDGFLNSEYITKEGKKGLDFAVMLTLPSSANYSGTQDFITNVQPFLIEQYFKNPAYKKVDNKLVVYCYNFMGFRSCFGGDGGMNTVLTSLNQAVIDQGLGDGIIFVADITGGDNNQTTTINNFISNYSAGSYVYKWRYTWKTDVADNVIMGTKYDYDNYNNAVASIPMGFDNTPWLPNKIGIIDPNDVKRVCDSVVENRNPDDPSLIAFTCWDEWGEGHFFAPSSQNSDEFGYLQAIREAFTGDRNATDAKPTENAKLRMGVLYPEGRQMLKIRDDRRYVDSSNLTSLGTATLSTTKTRYKSYGNWGSWYGSNPSGPSSACGKETVVEEGAISGSTQKGTAYYALTVNNPDQVDATWSAEGAAGIDISQITAIKVNGYAQNSAEMVIRLATEESYATSSKYPDEFRFSGENDGDAEFSEVWLTPDSPAKLKGKLYRIQFNPTARTAVGSKFAIKSITFYTGNPYTEKKVSVDGTEYKLVSEPQVSDTTYIPAYKFLIDIGAYPVWNKNANAKNSPATGSLTIQKNGRTVVVTAGSKIMTVDGVEEELQYAPYYEDGNLFIPYSGVMERLGYSATLDNSGNVVYTTAQNHYGWYFDTAGNTEGWTAASNMTLTVADGFLKVDTTNTDNQISVNGLAINKKLVKYAVIRLKKTDANATMNLRLYHGDSLPSAAGVMYQKAITKSNNLQQIVIDLANDWVQPSGTSARPYAELGDTITKVRLDPMPNYTGTISIDSIEFTDVMPPALEQPEAQFDYELKAYAWGDNMFAWDSSKVEAEYSGISNTSGLPERETVDGYENVMKLIPPSSDDAHFRFTKLDYNFAGDASTPASATKSPVRYIAKDDRMVKISFWYKAAGSGCKEIRFENRQGGKRDREEFSLTDASTTEWKYFENYLDLSKVEDEGTISRWFLFRVRRNGSTGGAYIRDLQIRCLEEENEVSLFTQNGVAIKVINNGEGEDKGSVYFAEYKGDVLDEISIRENPDYVTVETNIGGSSYASNQEKTTYHYFTPKSGTTKIKAFLWDEGLEPLSEAVVLEDN